MERNSINNLPFCKNVNISYFMYRMRLDTLNTVASSSQPSIMASAEFGSTLACNGRMHVKNGAVVAPPIALFKAIASWRLFFRIWFDCRRRSSRPSSRFPALVAVFTLVLPEIIDTIQINTMLPPSPNARTITNLWRPDRALALMHVFHVCALCWFASTHRPCGWYR